MDPNSEPWPPQCLIDGLSKECGSRGPLYEPMPCGEAYASEHRSEPKAHRVNLGTMHVAKVDPKDNQVGGRPELQEAIKLVRQRAEKLQFPLLTENMVSGYGGFVPKNQFQLGQTYRDTCIKSIGELEAEKKKGRKGSEDCQPLATTKSLPRTDAGSLPYIRPHNLNTNDFLSVYKMANDDPEKHYKSGYAGWVPRTLNKIGTNVVVTHRALNEFTDALKKLQKPVDSCHK